MPTYLYETIPQTENEIPLRFELRQGINEPKLTAHPETGQPVRRLISGGFLMEKVKRESVGSVTDPSWHDRG